MILYVVETAQQIAGEDIILVVGDTICGDTVVMEEKQQWKFKSTNNASEALSAEGTPFAMYGVDVAGGKYTSSKTNGDQFTVEGPVRFFVSGGFCCS